MNAHRNVTVGLAIQMQCPYTQVTINFVT